MERKSCYAFNSYKKPVPYFRACCGKYLLGLLAFNPVACASAGLFQLYLVASPFGAHHWGFLLVEHCFVLDLDDMGLPSTILACISICRTSCVYANRISKHHNTTTKILDLALEMVYEHHRESLLGLKGLLPPSDGERRHVCLAGLRYPL
ncbi:uncharacterized protein BO95DRAFT_219950 [Aspergillus brunneoviolaceus CBS 621.78]|uniref:Uncharacterized protein n=1 Tax=Aspergillus brunneoviolaceus CBS 621.78 TaxID=1450534 RepID=A0ACD1GL25_9EURO|nr:hypothetical protein BO95DRAFT_219950 [Aspergillus brunneoviolaceus CBS 621.78]RAH49989.1 hypothetical protein BO95DRAFT_219950 [Aspergillus brunneoviolaceus CBS 621.78]